VHLNKKVRSTSATEPWLYLERINYSRLWLGGYSLRWLFWHF